MTHQDQLLIHALAMLAYPDALAVLCTPQLEEFLLLFATAKQENAPLRILLYQLMDDMLHEAWRINLTLMSCKRGYTNPLLIALLRTELGGQQVQIAALSRKDRTELL